MKAMTTSEAEGSAPVASSGGVFYGWVIVASLFVSLMFSSGLGFYNASIVLGVAVDELNTSVTAVSGATALFFAVGGSAGFFLSGLMDRIDIRWFFAVGGLAGAVALTGLRWVDSVIELYVFFTILGIGFGVGGLLPSTTLVARWFSVRRSVAMSIASTGLSTGGIAITPLASRVFDARGLAGSGPWLGLAWFCGIVPLSLLLLRSRPSDKGLEPDGAPRPATPAPITGALFTEAKSTRFYQFLCVVFGLIFLAQVGGIAQMFRMVSERIDSAAGAAAVSTLALASVVGRLLGGVVVTKVRTLSLIGMLILVQSIGLGLFAFATTRSMVTISAVIFGISVGNLLMLQPLLIAEVFGVREYSKIYSFNMLFGTIGVAGGPFLLGILRDLFSYQTAFLTAAGINVLAFVLFRLAGPAPSFETAAPAPA